MTTDFDDILNITKRDFMSKPTTTVYFIKNSQVYLKLKSNDSEFNDKFEKELLSDRYDEIMLNGESSNIDKIKNKIKEYEQQYNNQ